MKVVFESYSITEKETGDTLIYIDRDLYSLPDTIFVGCFTGTEKHCWISFGAEVGAEYLVRVKTHEPDKEWYTKYPRQKDELKYLENAIEKQGKHESIWLGPYTVPDTTNAPEGTVIIRLPEIKLSRLK